jgi:hypothetical protein
MKLHKFTFKNEAVWMALLSLFPLLAGILVFLLLFLTGKV